MSNWVVMIGKVRLLLRLG